MPVEKFRDLEEARRALWVDRDDPRLWERIAAVWERAALLAPPCPPRGVLKFRSMKEANREREERERERSRRLREERLRQR